MCDACGLHLRIFLFPRTLAELDTKMSETQGELERLKEDVALKDEEITLLKTAMSEKDEESQKRQSMLEEKLNELERMRAGQNPYPNQCIWLRINPKLPISKRHSFWRSTVLSRI